MGEFFSMNAYLEAANSTFHRKIPRPYISCDAYDISCSYRNYPYSACYDYGNTTHIYRWGMQPNVNKTNN